jgi:phosphoglycerate dehydrogenase-like enzyme
MKIWIDESTLKENHIAYLKEHLKDHDISIEPSDMKDAEVAVLMPGFIHEAFISQMPSLKFVKCLTAGYDRADLSVLKERNIKFAYAKDVFSIQIAEDVISKILYFNRRLHDYDRLMQKHTWEFKVVNHELYHSTIGIVGAGSIGHEIAKRLKAFECEILGYRRTSVKDACFDHMYHDQKGLEHLLIHSDYVIIALPLNDHTKHFISDREFAMMKKTSLVINIARGEIIDQEALIKALNQGLIRGAALDVTTPEPLPSNHPLWDAKNIFITPHQASSSPFMHQRLIDEVLDTLKHYIAKEPLDNLVEL